MKNKMLKTLIAALSAGVLTAAPAMAEGETCRSYLTGREVPVEIGRQRPIAVMFNNIIDAVPQYGISKAEVLMEAEVEGLITRICGVMEDYSSCSRIGSIRSARNYYYYFAREFQATYCHFGEAAYCLPLLMLDSTWELNGLEEEGGVVYYRSSDRVSPHNAFTDYSHVQAGLDYLGLPREYPEAYRGHNKFQADGEEITPDGMIANVVMPGYPYNHARFDYNESDGLYYRSQYYEPQIDGDTGEQLAYKNVILQYCESNPFDENGYLWTDNVTGGSGKYITNGRCMDITWKKPYAQEETTFMMNIESPYLSVPVYTGDFEPTHYYDAQGNEIALNQGKTWICLVRNSAANKVVITDNRDISTDAPDSL